MNTLDPCPIELKFEDPIESQLRNALESIKRDGDVALIATFNPEESPTVEAHLAQLIGVEAPHEAKLILQTEETELRRVRIVQIENGTVATVIQRSEIVIDRFLCTRQITYSALGVACSQLAERLND